MDNVTHALAGCLFAAATVGIVRRATGEPTPAFRRAAVILGVAAAEFPDVDLVYAGERLGMRGLGYLLHHRGHTHTVVFALASALVLWGLTLVLSRELRMRALARPLLALSLVGTLSHVLLDYTNSYGVHPWWPANNRWIYGDAVFIVEPWLWVASLPPLLLAARALAARLLFGLLLAVILVAAWRVEMVGDGVALVLTIGAVLWTAITWASPLSRRVAMGLVVWMGLEVVFFAASAAGRRVVVAAVGPTLRDAALTPSPGDPLCLSLLAVTEVGGAYSVESAMVAPVPAIRRAGACSRAPRGVAGGALSKRSDSPSVQWGGMWTGDLSELRDLARTNCEVAAALRFMRVPIWRRLGNGAIELSDLRFGDGGGGFASFVAAASPARCPRHVPGWEWPRGDVLRPSP